MIVLQCDVYFYTVVGVLAASLGARSKSDVTYYLCRSAIIELAAALALCLLKHKFCINMQKVFTLRNDNFCAIIHNTIILRA